MKQHKTIKLMFTDFWHAPTIAAIQENPIYRLLSKHWNITLSNRPDFLIYSWKGFEYLKYDCPRIFYTGENIRPDFSRCDYAFSFDYPVTERNFRLPLYRLFPEYPNLFQPRNPDKIISENRKFCCFLSSNPKAHDRTTFFEMLSKYKLVDSGGKALNNIGYQIGSWTDKLSWMEGYKFSVAFENSQHLGYTTEKLLHALVTNTIPIYWGNPLVAKDFNTKAFINCHDYGSFDDVIGVIKMIDQNISLYQQYLTQPFMPNDTENEFCQEDNILARFESIFTHKKYFVSPWVKNKQKYQYLSLRAKNFRAEIKGAYRRIEKIVLSELWYQHMYWRIEPYAKKILIYLLSFLSKKGNIPIRIHMGGGKQKTISRSFVDKFIQSNKDLIHGHILEIGRNVYKGVVPPENIVSYSCLDTLAFSDIDIVADIQSMPHVEADRFDTIICTQVLEHVPNPFNAVSELYRILRPGGKLLITVPFLNNYHMEPDDYWRFTEYALAFLLKKFSLCAVASHGATFHHVVATLGYRASEVDLNILERADVPKFPVIISAIAQK